MSCNMGQDIPKSPIVANAVDSKMFEPWRWSGGGGLDERWIEVEIFVDRELSSPGRPSFSRYVIANRDT